MAMGTWSGVARARRSDGALGLIWIDAHLDAHTPATTPSGNRHGMPIAYLLGCGDDALRHLAGSRPALRPQNVCIVGVRSCERQEAALLRRLGVRVIGDDEIARIGVEAALRSAMEIVRRGTIGFGVSLDLDVIDPVDAPGVGTPVAGGIPARALSVALEGIGRQPGFVGLELVEYNPDRDRDGRTARIAVDLARGVFRIKSGHHA